MNTKERNWWKVAGFVILALLAIIGTGTIVALSMGWLKQARVFLPEIGLTLLLISGISTLLILLSIVAAIFAALNLSNRTHSLGLPEGSVRAMIALSLILIFTITSVFLYGQLGKVDTAKSTGISQEQLNTIPKEQIVLIQAREVAGGTVFDVEQRVEKSKASQDFANHILTTVSTLVVAVAGFYFGTRAVATARGTEAPLLPIIRKIVPNHGEQDRELSVEIFGKNFQSPVIVKLVQDSSEIPGTDVVWSTTKINCKFKIPKDAEMTKKWDLIIINEDGGEDRLIEAFEVKKKAQSSE